MGRSINCLFIKTNNPNRLNDLLIELLDRLGHPSIVDDSSPGSVRSVEFGLFQLPHEWIAISYDMFHLIEKIASDVAVLLSTDLFLVWTNDSSSWHYQHYRGAKQMPRFFQPGSEEAALEELGGFDPEDPSTFDNLDALTTFKPSLETRDWSANYDAIAPLLKRRILLDQFNEMMNRSCFEDPWGAESFASEFLDLLGIPKLFLKSSHEELCQLPEDDLDYYDSSRLSQIRVAR